MRKLAKVSMMVFPVLAVSARVAAASVIVSEVRAAREPGHLRVDVRGDGAIDPDLAHAKVDDGRLFLFLGGTRVRADNRSWDLDDGLGNVEAHRHHGYIELVVPLASNGCAGPVEIAATDDGLTALVGCGGASAPVATPGRTASTAGELARRQAMPDVEPPTNVSAHGQVGRLVAQQPREADPPSAPLVKGPAPAAVVPAVAPSIPAPSAPAVVGSAGADDSAERAREHDTLAALVALPAPPPRVPAAGALAPPTPSPAVGSSADGLPALSTVAVMLPAPVATPLAAAAIPDGPKTSLMVPALGLVALAAAAFIIARRRKSPVERQIQIIETASLGPKRTLVMARIGGETLLLGSSEAGITLLKANGTGADALALVEAGAGNAAAAATATATATATAAAASELLNETDIPIVEALADIPDPRGDDPLAAVKGRSGFRSIEGGLASLFGRSVAAGRRSGAEDFSGGLDDVPGVLSRPASLRRSGELEARLPVGRGVGGFDDILEDSIEDQELRQKLAAGLSARAR